MTDCAAAVVADVGRWAGTGRASVLILSTPGYKTDPAIVLFTPRWNRLNARGVEHGWKLRMRSVAGCELGWSAPRLQPG